MKKGILLFILMALSLLILSGCNKKPQAHPALERIKLKQEIVVGVKGDSKPFGFIENGEYKGFDVDVAKCISKKLFGDEERVKFVTVNAQNRISKLYSGEIDMIIATMSTSSSRSEIVDFSVPYYIAGQVIMVPVDSYIHSIKDLNDKNVAIVLGTTGENTLRQLAPSARLTGSISYVDAYNKLKNGEVEAVLADDSLLYGFVMDNKNFKILPRRYTKEYYAVAIEKVDNSEFKKILNNILQEMQENGTLHRIRQKWTPTYSPKKR